MDDNAIYLLLSFIETLLYYSYVTVVETTVSCNSASSRDLLRAIESNIGSHDRFTDRSFSAIVGLSFIGKTQMAFRLAVFKYPVIYFNFVANP